ncbi:MAG TPA: metal-dependent hydrolase [Pyrinomonadaceae bacterium]|jgi:membrane-bound metal-dependent hydrolase YbcI (DUF457 family)|nr:metal-dependent hydrolase [Pyrinomonadaceae bacterium]
MPLPVAHALLGAAVGEALRRPARGRRRKILLTCALLGVCPDFDYALNWLRVSGGGWHHGFTHSIAFAALLGLLTAVVLRDVKARSVLVFGAATASHTLLDLLVTDSRGVTLWWPFTNRRYRLGLDGPVDYVWSNASVWDVVVAVLGVSVVELIIFGSLLAVVFLVRRSLGPGAGGSQKFAADDET